MASLLFGNLAKMNLNPRSQAWCGLYPQMRGIPREAVSSHLPLPLGFCFQTCVFCSVAWWQSQFFSCLLQKTKQKQSKKSLVKNMCEYDQFTGNERPHYLSLSN